MELTNFSYKKKFLHEKTDHQGGNPEPRFQTSGGEEHPAGGQDSEGCGRKLAGLLGVRDRQSRRARSPVPRRRCEAGVLRDRDRTAVAAPALAPAAPGPALDPGAMATPSCPPTLPRTRFLRSRAGLGAGFARCAWEPAAPHAPLGQDLGEPVPSTRSGADALTSSGNHGPSPEVCARTVPPPTPRPRIGGRQARRLCTRPQAAPGPQFNRPRPNGIAVR